MGQSRFEIANRHGLKIVGLVEAAADPQGLVFIAHGQGGFKEQLHIQAFRDVYFENGYTVVRFDATHSLGESGGELIDVTETSYIEDLEDVVKWAKSQSWYVKTFALCGHSMGGMSVAYYAEMHPEQVSSLAPISTLINSELHLQTKDSAFLQQWLELGYYESASVSKPDVIKRVGWGFMEDLKKYDLLEGAAKLTMPVLLIAGEKDEATPFPQQQIFYEAIPGNNKTIKMIKDADHNFRGPAEPSFYLNQLKMIMSAWLQAANR